MLCLLDAVLRWTDITLSRRIAITALHRRRFTIAFALPCSRSRSSIVMSADLEKQALVFIRAPAPTAQLRQESRSSTLIACCCLLVISCYASLAVYGFAGRELHRPTPMFAFFTVRERFLTA